MVTPEVPWHNSSCTLGCTFGCPRSGNTTGGNCNRWRKRRASGRSISAGSSAFNSWPPARSGHVCGRRRGAAHSRPCAEAASGGRGLSHQCRPLYLRSGDADPVVGIPGRRHPPAGHDGRHLRFGRPDAVDGGGARCRHSRNLRLGDSRGRIRGIGGAVHGPPAAAVSAGRDRHHHPGHRRLADAGRDQLGGRRFADPDQGRRRRVGGVSQSKLRPASGTGDRAVRAAGDPRPDPLVLRLHRQHVGVARDHCGRGAGRGARGHAFRPASRPRPGSMSSCRSVSACRNFRSFRSSPCAS